MSKVKNQEITKKKKKNKKKTNLGARIFAIFMLIMMITSVFTTCLAYIIR